MLATILDREDRVMAHAPLVTCSLLVHNGEAEKVAPLTYRMNTLEQFHAKREARKAIIGAYFADRERIAAEREEFWQSVASMPAPEGISSDGSF